MISLDNPMKAVELADNILAFRIRYEKIRSNLQLPRGEKWNLHFGKKHLYIEFGSITQNGKFTYNVRSILKLQKRLPKAKLSVYKRPRGLFRGKSNEEYYDYEGQFPGDSLPKIGLTREDLDKTLDEICIERRQYLSGE